MHDSRVDDPDLIRLTQAARRLLRATRLTTAEPAEVRAAADQLDAASTLLESRLHTGPLWLTGRDSFTDFELTHDLRRMFPFSPATGVLNPVSPTVTLDLDGNIVLGEVVFPEIFNGPPFDYVHGGAIAMVFDELLAAAAIAADAGGYTARLTVSYRKVTPMLVPIDLRSWIEDLDGRKFTARGEMRLDGKVLTEGEGLFIRPQGTTPEEAWSDSAHAPEPAERTPTS